MAGSAFKGKVAFITGASSGIGAALAREFAAQGADLVLGARRADRLDALAAELARDGHTGRVLAYACDVARDGDVERVVAAAHGALGGRPFDVVIANAGFGVADRVERLTIDDFRRQFETNVFGVLRTVYATLPDLKKTKGRLAITGSVNGFIAPPTSGPYALSKFSVRALSYLLHTELRPHGISVTHIAPGFVTTEIFQVNKYGTYNPETKIDIPAWLRMPADTAARHIARAIRKRKREAVITFHGKVIVWLVRHFPWLVYGMLGIASKRGWTRRRKR